MPFTGSVIPIVESNMGKSRKNHLRRFKLITSRDDPPMEFQRSSSLNASRNRQRVVEHHQTISHIDRVRLVAVFHDGTIGKLPLLAATHSDQGNVKQELKSSDDIRIDIFGANHNNGTSEEILLVFNVQNGKVIIDFFFIIKGYNAISKT